MKKFKTMVNEFLDKSHLNKVVDEVLNEAKEPTHMAPDTAAVGKAKLAKPDPEKHNPTYHQKEPVPFKKPTAPTNGDDELPTAEADQKEVNDRMKKQADVAVEKGELTEAQKFRKLQQGLRKACEVAAKRRKKE